jgi:hypothetical protein
LPPSEVILRPELSRHRPQIEQQYHHMYLHFISCDCTSVVVPSK